ncbi:MAG: tautomerase family protein [Spirochaetes bacterium]|nr:tautomerase family protein [Spirochaetota bacterium]
MPLVRIEIIEGNTNKYKQSLIDNIHRALVDSFKIPEDDKNLRIIEIPKNDFIKESNKTDNFTIIELTIFKGRSREAKKLLYKNITAYLSESLGISPFDIIIYINEPSLENWGIAGGKPADEVDLGFDINV